MEIIRFVLERTVRGNVVHVELSRLDLPVCGTLCRGWYIGENV
jgi:hypothetical protein